MYKSTSKNRQKPCRKETYKKVPSQNAADDANKRRSEFFWEIVNCFYYQKALPSNLPPWVTIEIERFGGARSWVKKNYYWQIKYKEEQQTMSEIRNSKSPSIVFY